MRDRSRSSYSLRRRAQRRPSPVLALILGLAFFAGGFYLFFSVGGWMRTGNTPAGAAQISERPPASAASYVFTPNLDLRALRDLAYVPVKGIHVTADAAGSSTELPKLLALADQTEINAFVIDVKDESGHLTYAADVPLAQKLGLIVPRIKDIDGLMSTLAAHKIVPIARIVCFADDSLARKEPGWAIQSKKGGPWKNDQGAEYLNPYNRQVWEYLVEVGEDAARHGFREIQFDYVRFPSEGPLADAVYPGADMSKEDDIAAFLSFARARLEKLGVWVSADIFGLSVSVKNDMGIGQNAQKMAASVDIVSPMVYPSHYDPGSFGIKNPNGSPYQVVSQALKDAKARLAGTGALVRPWLQDFNLGSPPYGVTQVKQEIKAVEDQGYTEWILWNPSDTYTEGALGPQ